MEFNSITIKSNGEASDIGHDARVLVDSAMKIKGFMNGFTLADLVKVDPLNFPTEEKAFVFIGRPEFRDYCELREVGKYHLTNKACASVNYTVVQAEFDGSPRKIANNKSKLKIYVNTRAAVRRSRVI